MMFRGRMLARSLRANEDLVTDPAFQRELLRVLRRNGFIAPIAGAAANLVAGVTTQTANVGLTGTAANLFPVGGAPLNLNVQQQLPAAPWGLVVCQVQEITGVSAGATATVALNQTAGATTTQIGGGITVNQAAGSGPIDTSSYFGLLSGPVQNVTATGLVSTGTGTVTNSATLPSVLAVLSFL